MVIYSTADRYLFFFLSLDQLTLKEASFIPFYPVVKPIMANA